MESEPYHSLLILLQHIQVLPVTINVIVALVVMFILLLASAQISGSEVAFFSLSPQDKENLNGSKSGKESKVLDLLQIPERLLATILISNNLINVGIVMLSTHVMSEVFDFSNVPVLGFVMQVVLVTFILLVFGEILPKVYATQNALRFSQFMSGTLYWLEKFFWNIGFSRILVRSIHVLERNLNRENKQISIDELGEALELAKENLNEDKNILEGIVKFGNIDVKEIMCSRVDVIALEIKTPLSAIVENIIEYGYSRIPIYEETFDHIKGILYIKDLLPHLNEGDSFNWQSLIREPYYTPENKRINDLLKEFQTQKIHMAIVIDEYGGSSGIITLEDVLEEIVGEISDESDDDELIYQKLDDYNYIFEGKSLLNDFCKILEIGDSIFDEIRGDAETLAGLILEMEGDLPKRNRTIRFKQFIFTIRSVDKRRIKEVHVEIKLNS